MRKLVPCALVLLVSVFRSYALQTTKPKTEATPPSPAAVKLDAVTLKGLKARALGPAVMSGRVSEIALDPQNRYTFYVGLGTGGLMKTEDDGGTFQAIFEKESVASIGAVSVAPSDPKTVWVGTGEASDRNSVSWGDGVYLSTDGGTAWENVGLKESKIIARIVVHPNDPKIAWVAVAGELWAPSAERGLYKTTDAGKSWKAVLQAPAPYAHKVGCGDVVLDPSDPNALYAALYARQRTPWSFVSGPDHTDGKDVGGIFKSTDGGMTWKKLEKGLPARTARIGLDICRKNERVLYAVVQSNEGGMSGIDDLRSKRGGVFRSEDAGESWIRTNSLNPRPFYFCQIRVDPANEQRVFVLGFALHFSEDGGKSFREDHFAKVHPDCHDLVIDPRDSSRVLLGTDGGVYQSFDGSKSWVYLNRMAAGEFYRINVDLSVPYRICGGLQDNLNWVGPSMTRSKDGILNEDWINIGGGDGFYCAFDPEDQNIVFAESQSGVVRRFHLKSGEFKNLRPEPAEGQPAFRFHWNTPLIGSRHAKHTLYLAGNRVFKLTERGDQWTLISPDLSTQDPGKTTTVGSGAETFGVVYTLAESPLKLGLLWAGTDDGKVWLTENDGGSWTDLTPNLPPAVKGHWISRIEPSWHDAKAAYLAIDGHRTGSYAPLLYRSGDGGKSWVSIASNLPPNGPVKVVREDPRNPNLLYAGTEFALFITLDRGANWIKFGGLPTVAIDDLVVHPREFDLVIATHGRSLFVLDDLRPLQELTAEVQTKDAHLFSIRPAFGFTPLPGFVDWAGKAVYRGDNPPVGAIIDAWVKSFTGDQISIAITNASDQPVANLTMPGAPGINRIIWDLRPTKDLLTEYGGEGQKFVRPGEYTVTLTYGKLKQTQKVKVEIAEGVETLWPPRRQ